MSLSPYDELADIYDSFQEDISPDAWASYLDTLIRKYGPRTGDGEEGALLLADLGCGTGTILRAMARRGYDAIGIDASPRMLAKAAAESSGEEGKILYLCQDISRMELFGTVDVFLCLLDTWNHLTRKKDIERMLASFRNYLNPGGLFIFDVVTEAHLRDTLGNSFFYRVGDDFSLLWQNNWSPSSSVSTSEITVFSRDPDGRYKRGDARIREKLYSDEEIRDLLRNAGLEPIGCYGELSHKRPTRTSKRIFYVARRPA